jgi:hypothetical protein
MAAADKGGTYRCEQGACLSYACITSADCNPDEDCIDRDDRRFPIDNYAFARMCFKKCVAESDCATDDWPDDWPPLIWSCANGYCEMRGTCRTSDDCPEGEICASWIVGGNEKSCLKPCSTHSECQVTDLDAPKEMRDDNHVCEGTCKYIGCVSDDDCRCGWNDEEGCTEYVCR